MSCSVWRLCILAALTMAVLETGINVINVSFMAWNTSIAVNTSITVNTSRARTRRRSPKSNPNQFCLDQDNHDFLRTLPAGQAICTSQNSPTYTRNDSIPQRIGQLNLPTSLPKEKHCLKFIHIPKAAGTTIEQLGRWGRCDSNLTCSGKKTLRINAHEREVCSPLGGENASCSLWHTPPSDDPLLAQSYSCCKTFCVVRHPVDRWISEYKFYLRYRARPPGQDPCSWQSLNRYSEELLSSYSSSKDLDYARDCHLLPQSKYVISNDGKRVHCNHVIHVENLEAEFNALMKAYNFPQRLNTSQTSAVSETLAISANCMINVSETVKQWIYTMYQRDFELFGYG